MIAGKSEQDLVRLVQELATRTRREIEADNLASDDLASIAEKYGLMLDWDDLPDNNPGCYIASNRKIVLNRRVSSQERLNFTFYHELVHRRIKEDEDLLSDIHEVVSHKSVDEVIERLCEAGAAELLMPADDVREMIAEHGFSTALIPVLCERYGASSIAVAIQMVSCASHDCYFFIAENQLVPLSDNQAMLIGFPFKEARRQRLWVVYSGGSSAAKYPMARNIPVQDGHLMYSALGREGEVIKGKADIPRRDSRWKKPWVVDCDVLCFRGKVFAFFSVEPPVASSQLRLF
jgi:Zn-dependent peptidase ImmA (M78 family)